MVVSGKQSNYFIFSQGLTRLALNNNSLDDAGCTQLALAMQTNSKITDLDLSSNKIKNAGGLAICELLKVRLPLREGRCGHTRARV